MAKEVKDLPTIPNLEKQEEVVSSPKFIGPYKIESLFKKGGMSILYLAQDPKTSLPIIIKVLSPKYIQNKEVIDRFLKEAEIISLSNHPNIIKLYGQGSWEKGLYIAMEFIQGISLKQFILHRSLSIKRALEIVLQVAYALCHLHTHGIIHRDLKPENILITENGEIKVIDFGIAQLHKGYEEDRITKIAKMMGTPIYMSPEQKEDPKNVSFPSDIFSLGIITYELVLGRLSHGVINLSLLPKNLRKILDKALKINPKERYQDVVDFITDIAEYLATYKEISEKTQEEEFDEIFDSLKKSQTTLIPQKTPAWPNLEIGFITEEGLSLNGTYIDFFHPKDNCFVIFLAQPKENNIESFVYSSFLKGLFTMLMEKIDDFHPAEMLNMLNEPLKKGLDQKFTFSCLVLFLNKNQLLFSSSFKNNLWHVDKKKKKIISLSTPNDLLGANNKTPFVETAYHWNHQDRLILNTPISSEKKEDQLKQTILDNLLHSAKAQTDKLLNTITKSEEIRKLNSAALIYIQRKD
ncbi:MAG: serine/threonine protein kinase [Chlamydiae bacterium]|nr:serine/threonine protein kinase [Chlamydiota bacterium]